MSSSISESAFAALGVSPLVVSALDARGYTTPTAVQTALLKPEHANRDIMVSSQTGSGKTAAFGLLLAPSLEGLPRENGNPCSPRVMVIAPTRELALQVREELAWILAPLRVRVLVVTGGTSVVGDLRSLAGGADIVVGTPGRLNDHLTRGALNGAKVATVVLDEADEMLDMGFRDELEAILQTLPTERRTIMLSATLPSAIVAMAKRYQREPIRIAVDRPGSSNENITHHAHLVPPSQRFDSLVNLLLEAPDDRTLVFVRTRAEASDMGMKLAELGFAAAPLTGEMAQKDRTHTLEAFRAGRISALIATDVAARGIDVPEVGRVIHADLPSDASTLTHRSGRTGRAGRKGISVLLVPPFARGRANELLRAAGAQAKWGPVPGVDAIMTVANERLRTRLTSTESDAIDPQKTALATQLLADMEPVVLVAKLLREVRFAGPCEPRTIRASAEQQQRPRASSPMSSSMGGYGGGASSNGGGGGHGHVMFRVNFGERDGATPSRLLAMVCRRGNVRGNDVAAISIGATGSTFGVASGVADTFTNSASRRDVRDPDVRIERVDGARSDGPRSDGPRFDGPRPASRPNSFGPPPSHPGSGRVRKDRDRAQSFAIDLDTGFTPRAPSISASASTAAPASGSESAPPRRKFRPRQS